MTTVTRTNAGLSAGLRLVQLVLLGIAALAVARGALYGLVDDGPYDGSWGGPTRTGAWLVHAAIAVPLGAAAVLLLVAVERLRARLVVPTADGEPTAWWVRPAALTACTVTALFVAAWTQQL